MMALFKKIITLLIIQIIQLNKIILLLIYKIIFILNKDYQEIVFYKINNYYCSINVNYQINKNQNNYKIKAKNKNKVLYNKFNNNNKYVH